MTQERLAEIETLLRTASDCGYPNRVAEELCSALREAWRDRDEWQEQSKNVRYLFQVDDPCKKCAGRGRRSYGSTATWHHGIGGQMITSDVCDECWGSGEEHRKGANLRKLYATMEGLKQRSEQAERERDKALALADNMRDGLVKCANLTRHQECSPNTVAQVGAMVTNIVRQLVDDVPSPGS